LVNVTCAVRTGVSHFFSLASQQMRVRQQMPPPAFAS
jgi:hypothetical protein